MHIYTLGMCIANFVVLPFSMATTTGVFAKMLDPVFALLRQPGTAVLGCLDALQAVTHSILVDNEQITMCSLLGFR